MDVKRVCKGSVAMGWLAEHGDGEYIKRFCSGSVARKTWRWRVYQKGSVALTWLEEHEVDE